MTYQRGPRSTLPIAVQRLAIGEFRKKVAHLLDSTAKELQEKLVDPNTSSVDLALISILLKGIQEADVARLNFFFDRLYGKPKQVLEGLIKDETTEEAQSNPFTITDLRDAVNVDPFIKKTVEVKIEEYKNGIPPEVEPKERNIAEEEGIIIEKDPLG